MSIYTQSTKPLWVTSREACKLLGNITSRTLYTLRINGTVRAKPMNPQAKSPTWLYLYADLEKQS